MSSQDEEFVRLLRSTFTVEAEEHVQAIASGLLELEKAKGQDARRAVEKVFRAAHTLKGAARAVDFSETERLCQSLEDVFASWKQGESVPTAEVLDSLHRQLDAIIVTLSSQAAEPAPAQRPGSVVFVPESQQPQSPPRTVAADVKSGSRASGGPPPVVVAESRAAGVSEATVRVSVAKLESQILHAEEILAAKLTAAQRAADLQELYAGLGAWRKEWSMIEPDLRELELSGAASAPTQRLLLFVRGALETLRGFEKSADGLRRFAEQDRHEIGKLVDDLLDESKKLLLLPFATISGSFGKLVRDLARDQGKEVDLTIRGEQVEFDKRILEELKDAIVHLLRNSIDHGIEAPEERSARGKPPRAAVTIAVSQLDAGKVELVVSDDGAGISMARVQDSAVRQKVITAEEAGRLSEDAVLRLIFESAVTTSPIITQLSGRGLGLAIVREKAEKLGGEVTVETQPGVGTTFRIIVAAMRATFRGVLVEAAGQLLVVPTRQVERVTRTRPAEIETVQGRDTIAFEGRAVPLVRLADALELRAVRTEAGRPEGMPVMILGNGDQQVAYAVDSVLDEQEVLVKPLRPPLTRVRNVAGATVLGSGHVAPILNVTDLLKSARRSTHRVAVAERTAAEVPAAARSILVAEDSITSRMLLKSILESAGYRVKTAVDGMEAFTLLRAEAFDLVVSDVEMPRLSGFDLTARIRADQNLSDMPVVLVTALETREDRERGIDVGANAYIVKGSFDQSDLLEAVRRLI